MFNSLFVVVMTHSYGNDQHNIKIYRSKNIPKCTKTIEIGRKCCKYGLRSRNENNFIKLWIIDQRVYGTQCRVVNTMSEYHSKGKHVKR